MNPQTVWYSWQKKQELHPAASRICNPCAAASDAGAREKEGAVAFDIKCTKSRAPACTSLDKQPALFASNLISQTGCHKDRCTNSNRSIVKQKRVDRQLADSSYFNSISFKQTLLVSFSCPQLGDRQMAL